MASNLVNLNQFKSNNPLQSQAAAQKFLIEDAQRVRSAIAKNESDFNYNLDQPWERFQQAYPETTFKNKEEFDNFKNTYDPSRPGFQEYVQAYGPKEAMKILNRTGISAMWLGKDADEVREFDVSTAEWNPEMGGFDIQLRVADKKNNRSFTAPITRFGKKVKDLFTGGGSEAVEQEQITTLPIAAFENMLQGGKYAVDRYLGVGGTENLKGRQQGWENTSKAQELNQLSFFDTGAEERGKREDWLFSLGNELVTDLGGGQETPSPTDTQQPTTETAAPVGEVQTISQEAIDLGKQTFGLREGDKGILRKPKDVKAFNDAVGPDFYLSPNFQFTEEQEASLTPADKERILGRLKEKSDGNINISLAQIELQTKAAVQDINKQPGVTTDEVKAKKDVADFYSTFRSDLSSIFKANQSLYEEYKADPEAFANKYKNNINAIKGTPVSSTTKKELIEGSPFKLNDKDLNALNAAIKNNNLTEFTRILDKLTQNKDVPEAQQQRIVNFLGQSKNFVRTSKQRDLNHHIVLDMWASLPPDQRAAYGDYLMRFSETGYLTFEGVEQARKLSAERRAVAAAQKPGPMSDVTRGFQDLIGQMDPGVFDFDTQGAGVAEQIRGLQNQIQTQRDLVAFTDAAGTYLKRLVEAKGQPGFFDELLSFGQAKGPAPASFSLKPDVVAFDSDNNVTNDPEKAAYFAPMDPGGKAMRGSAITKQQILEIAGAPAIPLLMAVSTQNMKFRGQG